MIVVFAILSHSAKVVLEQLNRPPERRCPVARASNEVVELLCEHWEIFAPGCALVPFILLRHSLISVFADSTSTSFQPFFLNFYKVHVLATHFILRYVFCFYVHKEEHSFAKDVERERSIS